MAGVFRFDDLKDDVDMLVRRIISSVVGDFSSIVSTIFSSSIVSLYLEKLYHVLTRLETKNKLNLTLNNDRNDYQSGAPR